MKRIKYDQFIYYLNDMVSIEQFMNSIMIKTQ